jgi:polysaccharide export outer membrane protein
MMLASERAAEAQPGTTSGTLAPGSGAPGVVRAGVPGGGAPAGEVLVDEATYRLAPGDLIDVKFTYHPEENQRVPIRTDGRINLQAAGDIEAAGLTIGELESSIVEKSSATLRGPVVTIVIAQLADHKVYVGGQVTKPGFVVFRQGMTAMQAIVERGGFADDAKTDQIVHLHRTGKEVQARKLDLDAAFKGTATDLTALAPNDIIIVPRSFIGKADVFVDQYIRGLLPSIPQPGIDLPLLFF